MRVPPDGAWSHRRREPQRTSRARAGHLLHGPHRWRLKGHAFLVVAGAPVQRVRKRLAGFKVEVLQEVVLLRSKIRSPAVARSNSPANDEMWGSDSRSSARRTRAVHGCQQVVIAPVRWRPTTAHSVPLCAFDGGEPRCESDRSLRGHDERSVKHQGARPGALRHRPHVARRPRQHGRAPGAHHDVGPARGALHGRRAHRRRGPGCARGNGWTGAPRGPYGEPPATLGATVETQFTGWRLTRTGAADRAAAGQGRDRSGGPGIARWQDRDRHRRSGDERLQGARRSGKPVRAWIARGFDPTRGAHRCWHITASEISEQSGPGWAPLRSRRGPRSLRSRGRVPRPGRLRGDHRRRRASPRRGRAALKMRLGSHKRGRHRRRVCGGRCGADHLRGRLRRDEQAHHQRWRLLCIHHQGLGRPLGLGSASLAIFAYNAIQLGVIGGFGYYAAEFATKHSRGGGSVVGVFLHRDGRVIVPWRPPDPRRRPRLAVLLTLDLRSS